MRTKIFTIVITLIAVISGNSLYAQGGGRIDYAKLPTEMLPGISERDYAIYLPESYDYDSGKRYPVIYLLHGGFGSYKDWPMAGNLKATADRMMAKGEISEMIIVCPDGRCRNNTMWLDMDNWPAEKHFFNELIPYIESHYRVTGDKSGRAIAGLSLGGGAALSFALGHPEMFAAACGMSAYIRSVSEVVNPGIAWIQPVVNANNPIEKLNAAPENEIQTWKNVAWLIDCGDRDFTLPSNIALDETMNLFTIPHGFLMRKGAHNWKYWCESLPIVLRFINSSFADAQK